jgi:NADPH-dependent 2,4-dienoyl-CoA reductase/sulfur reductase-like enzyme
MRFLIIGGDAAGMSAASRVRRKRPDIDVTVLEMTRDVSYSACGMPYNIADGQRSIEELVVRQASVFRDKLGVDLRLGHRAEAIDREAKLVRGSEASGQGFDCGYDKLLIATGASPHIPNIPGLDAPGVMALKNLEQGRAIKEYLASRPVKRAVILGMGYIALEMAEALRARGLEVAMVKPRPELLPWMDRQLASTVYDELQAKRVEVHAGCEVQEIRQAGGSYEAVCSDRVLSADMLLVATGVRPNSRLAEEAGLELGPAGSIAVDRSMRTSDPDILSAGDCADAFHLVSGQRTWVPLALRANRSGRAAADAVAGQPVELPGVAGTAVFKTFELQVARTGLSLDEAAQCGFDPRGRVISAPSRAHAHPGSSTIQVFLLADAASGRLLGAQMVGREGVAHRINAVAVALQAGMSLAEFAQADLAYAPPFGPVWDPLLTAANQLLKAL